MLDLFNIAQPQNCDIQIFYGSGALTTSSKSWEKPRGVSHVYMLLIGPGGTGDGTTGGGSGAVTVWYGAAQHVPDILVVDVPIPGNSTRVGARFTASTITVLLTAEFGSPGTGGTATAANQFAASGFYQSIAGQSGTSGGITPSATTFLSGGGGNGGSSNYGYANSGGNISGFFQLQPIIVGVGTAGGGPSGIGCGGGNNAGAPGGPGMVLIASW